MRVGVQHGRRLLGALTTSGAVFCVLTAACGGIIRVDCEPGDQRDCACSDGNEGKRECNGGVWGRCVCESAPAADAAQEPAPCDEIPPESVACGDFYFDALPRHSRNLLLVIDRALVYSECDSPSRTLGRFEPGPQGKCVAL